MSWGLDRMTRWLFFSEKRPQNKTILSLGNDFGAQSWYSPFQQLQWRTIHLPPQAWILRTATSQWGSNLRTFITSVKSKSSVGSRWIRRSEQNPKLFSSHRCSGYFSLQMSPPQTTGCGNFNLWRASTLQTGLPTRQRLNWRHWRWKSSQILLARGLQFSHVASFLYSGRRLFNPIVASWRSWMRLVYWKNSA